MLVACGNEAKSGNSKTNEINQQETKDKTEEDTVTIKQSPDKYTWYIKNYVGRNCASFGGDSYHDGETVRAESYGKGKLRFVFLTADGSFVDPDKESLKNYIVTGQNIAPNTELKLVFQKNSSGVEWDYLIESQSIEEIELTVKRIQSSDQ